MLSHYFLRNLPSSSSSRLLIHLIAALLYLLVGADAQDIHAQQGLAPLRFAEDYGIRNTDWTAFDIEIDHRGYVYFAGQHGLYQFNGRDIRSVEGLDDDRNIVALFKDYEGRIWLKSYNGSIRYIRNDSVISFPLGDSLQALVRHLLTDLWLDKDRTLYLGFKGRGMVRFNLEGKLLEFTPVSEVEYGQEFYKVSDDKWLHWKSKATSKPELLGGKVSQVDHGRIEFIHPSFYRLTYESTLITNGDSLMYFSAGNHYVFKFERDASGALQLKEFQFPSSVIKLFKDSYGEIWIGTLKDGVFRTIEGSFERFQQYLNGACAAVAEDAFGGIWIKSNQRPFAYVPFPQSTLLSSEDQSGTLRNIVHLTSSDSSVYFSERDNRLWQVANGRLQEMPRISFLDKRSSEDIKWLRYDYWHQELLAGSLNGMSVLKADKWVNIALPRPEFGSIQRVRDVRAVGSRLYLGVSNRFLIRIEKSQFQKESIWRKVNGFYTSWEVFEDDTLIGAQDGLWRLNKKQFTKYLGDSPILQKPIDDLYADSNVLWVFMQGGRVAKYDGSAVATLTEKGGRPVMASSWEIEPDGNIWIRTSDSRILRIQTDETGHNLSEWSFDEMAMSLNHPRAFTLTKMHAFAASNKGLFMHPLSALKVEIDEPKGFIESLSINQQPRPVRDDYQLSYDQNFLSFSTDWICYRTNPLEFKHRLVGLDTGWVYSDQSNFQYSNLSAGLYHFQQVGRLRNGNWSDPIEFRFHIPLPYWETTWFRILVALCLIGLIVLIFSIRASQITKQERLKAELLIERSRLELRALKAQLNPHFIFNALSSVQYYLSVNKPENAEQFLHRFSALIRQVLENSEKNAVSLASELKLMRNYVSLESERINGDDILFEITADGVEPEEVFIPPALFQPYIENCVWHGLKHKSDGEKRISIRISKKASGVLEIVIEDNGIGRKAAADFRTNHKEHRSFGMMIASRRIKYLNQKTAESVQILDMQDENGMALGTKVTLIVPYQESES